MYVTDQKHGKMKSQVSDISTQEAGMYKIKSLRQQIEKEISKYKDGNDKYLYKRSYTVRTKNCE